MQNIVSTQAAKYVSERTVRHHVSPKGKFTVTRHGNRSCKYMEDMYCDNDNINMTPTRYSVLVTSESGDELISLREQFIGRAEQHLLQHVPRAKFGW